jgi:hypothetical protein
VGVVTTFTVAAGHPALAGHFPGAPIVPGVLLLDETVRAVERSQGDAPRRWQIGAAKFLKPVRPGESLSVEHEGLPNGSIRFLVSSGPSAVARGVLRPVGAAPAPARASGAQWAAEPERGSATLVAVMIRLSLALGRPLARGLLYLAAAYFFLFAPTARRHARAYLARALGRAATSRDRFRQIYAFACTILDRLYLMQGRYDLFDISTEGEPLMRAALERGTGAFLLGAHLGSFEVMGALGRRQSGLRVVMAMYEDTATKLDFAAFADPQNIPEVIPLGHLEAMLRIRERLDQGCFVGMLADRTIGEAPAERVSFLGSPALFPSGPMRAAAALRRPVFFMTGLYRGGNRYHVVFRQIADFARVGRGERERAVREAVTHYAAVLEEFCRSDPYNWFNFYDFWHRGAPGPAPPAPAAPARRRGR